jgi:hypothetical protein
MPQQAILHAMLTIAAGPSPPCRIAAVVHLDLTLTRRDEL